MNNRAITCNLLEILFALVIFIITLFVGTKIFFSCAADARSKMSNSLSETNNERM